MIRFQLDNATFQVQTATIYTCVPTLQSRSKTCSCSGASNGRCERAALNVSPREEPVFGARSIVTLAGQTKDTKMPVGTVGRSAGGEWPSSLGEGAVTGRVPEGDLVLESGVQGQYMLHATLYRNATYGREVDLVGYVVPLVGLELDLPLALTPHHPLPTLGLA